MVKQIVVSEENWKDVMHIRIEKDLKNNNDVITMLLKKHKGE